ncbi:hypothetical protein PaeCFBP13512_22170 [Paenibacillus sp. CFBP13512]|uniref:hypothetical protein n=1 Tax=Paenibacillus sp. CFBP13512 TaxID=2184007 RepID=UPI0010C102FC|nr:hypothetical protein [Paenibacillus sp. CFBP13512]TKJ83829.1 hypothetical protein PaeCFBP13512_22170 [Paenibacillus sp. CFBP13512]
MTLSKKYSFYILTSLLLGALTCAIYLVLHIFSGSSIPADWKTSIQPVTIPTSSMYHHWFIQSLLLGSIVFALSLLFCFLIIVLKKKTLNRKLIRTSLVKESNGK